MNTPPDFLRTRTGHDSGKVAFVELFFDLVFVFAITQLSHGLIHHFTLLGGLETLMLLLAVWWVWIYTTWVTNWLDPEKLPVRTMLLVMMVLGLVLTAAVPEAFESRGLVFAGAYVAMQVGRSLFFLWAVRGKELMVRNYQRIFVWLATSAVFWIAGGLSDGAARIALWAAALGIEYVGPSTGFRVPGLGHSSTTDWEVSGHHMAERCGLFIIIALGESILVTGATFSELAWSGEVVGAFGASVIGSIAMWWLYFDTASESGSHQISSSDDPGRLARLAYTYLHLLLVAGIILIAVADEFVLAHPGGHADSKTLITLLGGTAVYLLGNMLFKRIIGGNLPLSHIAGVVMLGAMVPFGSYLAPWLLSTLTTLLLIGVAAWERRARPCH
ncbi:MAG: low temperature requirement protein A [Verrucomicrobiaceae bacterium]|nr:MAG: low temperature requirement protein A [Verrucomicrobiaceae bacterium]